MVYKYSIEEYRIGAPSGKELVVDYKDTDIVSQKRYH